MKSIVIVLLLLLVCSSCAQQSKNVPFYEDPQENGVTEIFQVVKGFFVGAFLEFTGIGACFFESQEILVHFQDAAREFRNKQYIDVVKGLKSIGLGIKTVINTVIGCHEFITLIPRLKLLVAGFHFPVILAVKAGVSIVWHSVNIIDNINSMIKHYNSKDWYEMGKNIGAVAAIVFLKTERFADNISTEGTLFLDGIAHGLNPELYHETIMCISDVSDGDITTIKSSLQDLKWDDQPGSVNAFRQLTEVFKTHVKDCKASSPESQRLIDRLVEAMKSQNLEKALGRFFKNPLKFARIVSSIEVNLESKEFFDSGDIVGDLVAEAFGLNIPKLSEMIGSKK